MHNEMLSEGSLFSAGIRSRSRAERQPLAVSTRTNALTLECHSSQASNPLAVLRARWPKHAAHQRCHGSMDPVGKFSSKDPSRTNDGSLPPAAVQPSELGRLIGSNCAPEATRCRRQTREILVRRRQLRRRECVPATGASEKAARKAPARIAPASPARVPVSTISALARARA